MLVPDSASPMQRLEMEKVVEASVAAFSQNAEKNPDADKLAELRDVGEGPHRM